MTLVALLRLLIILRGTGHIKFRSEVEERARKMSYHVKCARAVFPLVGFHTLNEAREYAAEQTRSEPFRWNERSDNRLAKIYRNEGTLVETYISGFPEEEYNRLTAERNIEDERNETKAVSSFGWDPSKMR